MLGLIDPLDFAGTFVPELFQLAQGKLALVLTKMDLLPPIAKEQEIVAWCRQELAAFDLSPLAIFPLSNKNGEGIPRLLKFLEKNTFTKVALIGATNVGKSALLGRLLPHSAPKPTVSTLAGTTLGVTSRKLGRSLLLDTPGVTPQGRLDNYLCPKCQSELIPAGPIKSKLYELDPGQSLLFGTFGSITNLEETTVVQVYLPGSVTLHRTTREKAMELLEERPKWLGGACSACLEPARESKRVSLAPLEDLAIAGLGWLSLRRAGSTFEVILPQGSKIQVRDAMLQKR